MTRTHSLAGSLLLFGLLCFVSSPALACKCMIPEVASAREDAAAIFEGRVLAIAGDQQPDALERRKVSLSVVRTWKGLERDERIDVFTNESSAACGFPFASGASYLVYARESGGALHVSLCGRTRALADAAEDLALLGAGSTPVHIEPKANVATSTDKDASSAGRIGDAGTASPGASRPDRVAAQRRGGCATGRSQRGLALLLLLPTLGLVLRRGAPGLKRWRS